MSDREVRDQLMTLLLAGHETTATGLAWTLDLLTRHPYEIDRMRADGEPYVRAVVAESLRLRPVVPLAGRRLAVDLVADGVSLPAGTDVTPAIWLAHTRPEAYPDPYAFRPERFLEHPPSTYTWIPYGGGVRRCLGAAFAELEMRVVLGRDPAPLRSARRVGARRARRPPQRHVLAPPRHPRDRHRTLSRTAARGTVSPPHRADPARLPAGRTRVSARTRAELMPVRTWMSAATVAVSSAAPRDRLGRQCARRRAAGRAARSRRLRRPGRRARRAGHERGRPPDPAPRRLGRRRDRRPAHPSRARRAGPPSDRQPAAAGRTPRLGRRRAAVLARDPRLPAGRRRRRLRRSHRRRRPPRPGLLRARADGVAGPATFAALSRAPVRAPALRSPIAAPLGDRYGPRGTTFHAGLDFPAATGTSVTAAGAGRVVFAGYNDGWGNTVVLDHGNAVRTRYAHLSAFAVSLGAYGAAPARRSAASAPPATPPARTCTSRSRSAAPTPTRASRSGSTDAAGV